MADREAPCSVRKPRADARRNHARLLETAKAAFAEKGSQASMEEVARAAGVGIGTLYRHFPTRDALVEAVYQNEMTQLADAAVCLCKTHPPVEALRQWLLLFVDFMGAKQGMSEVLNSIVGGTSELYAASGAQVKEMLAMVAERAVASGEIRPDVDPFDLMRALAGVAYISAGPDWRPAAIQFVDILIAGIRTDTQKK